MRILWLLLAGVSLIAGPRPEHGIRYDPPATRWDEGLPLGNGMLGALVWGDGEPLRISIDRADLWDLRPVPEFSGADYRFDRVRRWHEEGRHADLKRMLDDPYNRPAPTRLPVGRIEITPAGGRFDKSALDIADGVASTPGASVFVHATEPVGLVRIAGAQPPAIRLVPPPFAEKPQTFVAVDHGHGALADLGYPPPAEISGDNWQAWTQQGWGDFRFAVYADWRQTNAGWLLAWSVASGAKGADPLGSARVQVRRALATGWDGMLASHRKWWSAYWSKSGVALPNPLLERLWYLELYKFGAASRRGAPPISLQAIWTADNGQIPPWKGDYHHDLNTQLSYWPCYSGNHLEEGLAYLDWLWHTRPAAFEWTKTYFRMPGLNVPMTSDLNGRQIGGWRQYTHSATTAAWLAQHFYLHWRYSGDREFLRERAYPYLRDAATFLDAYTSERDASGKRTHPLSSSPEINDNRPEARFPTVTNYDLALERWLMGAAAELASELNRTSEAARWRRVLAELPELATGEDGRLLVAREYPLAASHRHFSHLMAIHPLGLIDWSDGAAAQRTIRASLSDLERLGTSMWTGYSFAWLASLQARAHDGEKAEKALEIFATAFTSRNTFHVNGDQSGKGYSTFRYRPFTLEGNFAAAQGVQEMLLQSQRGLVVLFPAIPSAWKNVSFDGLRAEGAFVISAERRNGAVVRVGVTAERGGVLRMISPFTGKPLRLSFKAGENRVMKE